MENTINFEPEVGYVCLAQPKELEDKTKGKIFANLTDAQKTKQIYDYIAEHGSLVYEIIAIEEGSSKYKVGDKVMIDGEMEHKSILKPKETWKKENEPEFQTFIICLVGQIQGRLKY